MFVTIENLLWIYLLPLKIDVIYKNTIHFHHCNYRSPTAIRKFTIFLIKIKYHLIVVKVQYVKLVTLQRVFFLCTIIDIYHLFSRFYLYCFTKKNKKIHNTKKGKLHIAVFLYTIKILWQYCLNDHFYFFGFRYILWNSLFFFFLYKRKYCGTAMFNLLFYITIHTICDSLLNIIFIIHISVCYTNILIN